VNLISSSPRYSAALEQARDPEAYARAITAAGYATDPDYAEKWLSIYHGDRLNGALRDLKTGATLPTQRSAPVRSGNTAALIQSY
jgi:flagellum-specific peptidoglycan hydrolase FlgJ